MSKDNRYFGAPFTSQSALPQQNSDETLSITKDNENTHSVLSFIDIFSSTVNPSPADAELKAAPAGNTEPLDSAHFVPVG